MMWFSFSAPGVSRGTQKRAEPLPRASAVSRSAFLGGPDEILASESERTCKGRISTGGAKKAERRRAPGAARRSRQAKLCPRDPGQHSGTASHQIEPRSNEHSTSALMLATQDATDVDRMGCGNGAGRT